MTVHARLQKVTQQLSPLQRITLLLQAQRDGRAPDPDLGRVHDHQEAKAFNRYVALVYVINHELGALCYTNHGFTLALAHSAEQVRLLEGAASLLEEEHGLAPVKRPRDWRKPGEMEVPEFLRSLAVELRRSVGEGVGLRWRELGALEAVWQELAEEFGGEDPVMPEQRSMALETKDRLRELASELGCRRRLTGPDEATLAQVRRTVNEAFEKLEPLL